VLRPWSETGLGIVWDDPHRSSCRGAARAEPLADRKWSVYTELSVDSLEEGVSANGMWDG